MSDVTINCGNNNNSTTSVSKGDKVTFDNTVNNKSISLNLPEKGGASCFAPTPTSPVAIAEDGNAGPYTISSNANGTYDYDWTIERDASLTPRNGKIIVD